MASFLEQLATRGSVTLEGFGHQVGGQFRLMKWGDCVCKPLYLREKMFYESLSDDLKVFTPKYYGVVTVCFEQQPSGDIKMVALPHRAGGTVLNKKELKANAGYSAHFIDERISVGRDQAYMSPWCEQCTKVSTEKLSALGAELDSIRQDYIVLENLTANFSRPSILDLKVGSGNHDDYDTEEKRLRHYHNKKNSTTATLHVRVSGMQKYDAAQNQYIFRDKYYGRGLNEEGFREELRLFLHNGVQFRGDLLSDIISTLEELVRVVESQDCYRFFSSSLLIIYDGAECLESGRGLTTTNGSSTPSQLHMPTRGENGRSPNLSLKQTELLSPKDHINGTPSVCEGASHTHQLSNGDVSHDDHMTKRDLNSMLSRTRTRVDIRMIDFVHGVHSSFGGPEISDCDQDYLHGLKALLAKFKELVVTN